MASIGHIAIGMAAARLHRREPYTTWQLAASMLGWSGLSLLPDADVVGFRFGIAYADAWGHRGATHSFVFALLVAFTFGALSRLFRRGSDHVGSTRSVVLVAAVVASHPLLDTLTNGGLGCALWWPFDSHRHFAPWDPIPVAPLGRRFFSSAGFSVASTEVLLFSPASLCLVAAG